jgi:hypothetical protein
MKNMLKKVLIVLTLIIGFSPLYAGSGHSHAPKEVSMSNIKIIAQGEIYRLIKANTIDKSWANKNISKIEKYNKGSEWRVIFKNEQIKDTTKQTLYVFMNNAGMLSGANYTGK